MGIRNATNIKIIRKTPGNISVAAAGVPVEGIPDVNNASYPWMIGVDQQKREATQSRWMDYLLGAKRDEQIRGIKIYVLDQPTPVCKEFLADLSEMLNATPTTKKSIGAEGGFTTLGTYDNVSLQNILVQANGRKFRVDVWQNFEEVNPMTFAGAVPDGRFRIDIKDSNGRLHARSDMSREKNGRLRWIMTPESQAMTSPKDSRKLFDDVNCILNELTKSP